MPSERILGATGTVEEAYKYKGGKRYRTQVAPPRMGETSIAGAVPSERVRVKRARLEAQTKTTKPKPIRGGGTALWIEYLGYSGPNDSYGIRTKVRGMKAVIHWLPYHIAAQTWLDIAGTDFSEVVSL